MRRHTHLQQFPRSSSRSTIMGFIIPYEDYILSPKEHCKLQSSTKEGNTLMHTLNFKNFRFHLVRIEENVVDSVLSPSNAAGCRRKLAFPSPHAINEQTVPTLNQPIRKRKLIRPAVSFLVS